MFGDGFFHGLLFSFYPPPSVLIEVHATSIYNTYPSADEFDDYMLSNVVADETGWAGGKPIDTNAKRKDHSMHTTGAWTRVEKQKPALLISKNKASSKDKYSFDDWSLKLVVPAGRKSTTLNLFDVCFNGWDGGRGGDYPEPMTIHLEDGNGKQATPIYDNSPTLPIVIDSQTGKKKQSATANPKSNRRTHLINSYQMVWCGGTRTNDDYNDGTEYENINLSLGTPIKQVSLLRSGYDTPQKYDIYKLHFKHTEGKRPFDKNINYINSFWVKTSNSDEMLFPEENAKNEQIIGYANIYPGLYYSKKSDKSLWKITFEFALSPVGLDCNEKKTVSSLAVKDNDQSHPVKGTVVSILRSDYQLALREGKDPKKDPKWNKARGEPDLNISSDKTNQDFVDNQQVNLSVDRIYRVTFSDIEDENLLGFRIPTDPLGPYKPMNCNSVVAKSTTPPDCKLYIDSVNIQEIKSKTDIAEVHLYLARHPKGTTTFDTIETIVHTDPKDKSTSTTTLKYDFKNPLKTLDSDPATIPDDRLMAELTHSDIFTNSDYKTGLKKGTLGILIKSYEKKDGTKVTVSSSDYAVGTTFFYLTDKEHKKLPRSNADCTNVTSIVKIWEPYKKCENGSVVKKDGKIQVLKLEWAEKPSVELHIKTVIGTTEQKTGYETKFKQTGSGVGSQYIKNPLTYDVYNANKNFKFYVTGYYKSGTLEKFTQTVNGVKIDLEYPSKIEKHSTSDTTCKSLGSIPCKNGSKAIGFDVTKPKGVYNIETTKLVWPEKTHTKTISYNYHNGSDYTGTDTYYKRKSRQVLDGYEQICTTDPVTKVKTCVDDLTKPKYKTEYYDVGQPGYPKTRTASGKALSTANAKVTYTHGKVELDETKLKALLQNYIIPNANHRRDNVTVLTELDLPLKIGIQNVQSVNAQIDPDETEHDSESGDTDSRVSVRKSPQESDFVLTVVYHVINHKTQQLVAKDTITYSSTTDDTGTVQNLISYEDAPSLEDEAATYEWWFDWNLSIKQYIIYDWTYDKTEFSDGRYRGGDVITHQAGIAKEIEYPRNITYDGCWVVPSRSLVTKTPDCKILYMADSNPYRRDDGHYFARDVENATSPRPKTTVFDVGRSSKRTRLQYTNHNNKLDLRLTSANKPSYSVVQAAVYPSGHDPSISDQSPFNTLPATVPAQGYLDVEEISTAIDYPGKYDTTWDSKWETYAIGRFPSGTTWAGFEHIETLCLDVDDTNQRVSELEKPVYIWADPPTCTVEYTTYEKRDPNAHVKIDLFNPNFAPMDIDRDKYHIYERPAPQDTKPKISDEYVGSENKIERLGTTTLETNKHRIDIDGEYLYAWDIQTSMGNETWTTLNNLTNQRSWFEERYKDPNKEYIDSPNADQGLQCREILRIIIRPYVKIFHGGILAGGRFGTRQHMDACHEFAADTIVGDGLNVDGYIAAHEGPGTFYRGSSSQYEVIAHDQVDGFYSADQRLAADGDPQPLKGLTLGNVDTSLEYGGNFKKSNNCIANYWRHVEENLTPETTPASKSIDLQTDLGSLPLNDVRKYYDLSGGSTIAADTLTITNSAPNDLLYSKATIYVRGNIYITDDIINNESYAFLHPTQLGYLTLVAKGHIYIDPSVKRIDAVLVAYPLELVNNLTNQEEAEQGTIFTCMYPGGFTSNSSHFTTCKSQLTVNGALIAQNVKLGRIYASVREIGVYPEGALDGALGTPQPLPSDMFFNHTAAEKQAFEALANATFTDIDTSVDKKYKQFAAEIGYLLDKGVLAATDCDSLTSGTQFCLEDTDTLSRLDFAKWVVQGMTKSTSAPTGTGSTTFTDVTSGGAYIAYLENHPSVGKAVLSYDGKSTGSMTESPTFNPTGNATRAWVAVLLSSAFDMSKTNYPTPSHYANDISSYDLEVQKRIATLFERGITHGTATMVACTSGDLPRLNCTYYPSTSIKRQHVALLARSIVWYHQEWTDSLPAEVIYLLPEYYVGRPALPPFDDEVHSPDSTATIHLNF